jgi:hypothetical protein
MLDLAFAEAVAGGAAWPGEGREHEREREQDYEGPEDGAGADMGTGPVSGTGAGAGAGVRKADPIFTGVRRGREVRGDGTVARGPRIAAGRGPRAAQTMRALMPLLARGLSMSSSAVVCEAVGEDEVIGEAAVAAAGAVTEAGVRAAAAAMFGGPDAVRCAEAAARAALFPTATATAAPGSARSAGAPPPPQPPPPSPNPGPQLAASLFRLLPREQQSAWEAVAAECWSWSAAGASTERERERGREGASALALARGGRQRGRGRRLTEGGNKVGAAVAVAGAGAAADAAAAVCAGAGAGAGVGLVIGAVGLSAGAGTGISIGAGVPAVDALVRLTRVAAVQAAQAQAHAEALQVRQLCGAFPLLTPPAALSHHPSPWSPLPQGLSPGALSLPSLPNNEGEIEGGAAGKAAAGAGATIASAAPVDPAHAYARAHFAPAPSAPRAWSVLPAAVPVPANHGLAQSGALCLVALCCAAPSCIPMRTSCPRLLRSLADLLRSILSCLVCPRFSPSSRWPALPDDAAVRPLRRLSRVARVLAGARARARVRRSAGGARALGCCHGCGRRGCGPGR